MINEWWWWRHLRFSVWHHILTPEHLSALNFLIYFILYIKYICSSTCVRESLTQTFPIHIRYKLNDFVRVCVHEITSLPSVLHQLYMHACNKLCVYVCEPHTRTSQAYKLIDAKPYYTIFFNCTKFPTTFVALKTFTKSHMSNNNLYNFLLEMTSADYCV